MKKITRFLIEKKYLMPAVFALLCIVSIFTFPLTNVNFNSEKYLPDDTDTVKGLNILYDEFGDNGNLSVMVKNVSPSDALTFKSRIEQIENIEKVVWLDDIVLPFKPDYITEEYFWNNFYTLIAYIDVGEDMQSQLDTYYNRENSDALFSVVMTENDSHTATTAAIEQIDALGEVYFAGPAAKTYNNVNVTFAETFNAILIILPLTVLILLFATKSYFQPLLFLLITGVSVFINMGTNFLFGEISYITQATSAILQMALSVDYLIILSNRYQKEKQNHTDNKQAMCNAVSKSVLPVTASSLTTIAGFVALMFMRYTIGFDMGMVLAKGIFISLVTVFLLMPSLFILFDKIIEKTSHKTLNISFKGMFNALKKSRFILPALLVILIGFAAYAQNNNAYIYGDSAAMGGKGSRLYDDRAQIEQSFGTLNQLVILVPKEHTDDERQLTESLKQKEYITNVSSYSVAQDMMENAGEAISENDKAYFLGQMQQNFIGENYFRIILNLNVSEEGKDSTYAVADIENTVKQSINGFYLLGSSPAVIEIKTVTDYDYTVITAISILLVLAILIVTFRSILLPVLLVFVIQGSIWINMAYPYLFNQPIIFIGCIMVSCIQLGATIDYGILLSDRYMFYRKTLNKFDAAFASLQENKHTIITSAAIMSAAGFILSLTSSMPGVAMIGVLVGRGALSSALLVLILLPQLFMLFDKGIKYTTLKPEFFTDKKTDKEKKT